jgi:hypothetical protein
VVTSSVRTDASASTPDAPKHLALGYVSTPRARRRLADLAGSMLDVRALPVPAGPDGPCSRPLLFWDVAAHRPWLRVCGSGRSKVCPSCAATRKRRVRRIAHLGVLDRLAAGGYLALVTFTAPGDDGHLKWVIGGRAHARCGCESSAPYGMGAWNRQASRRWNHLRTLIRREYPGAEFYRAVEPQQRGALHLHVILWTTQPLDALVLQELALRAGFGCNTRLDVCRGPEDGARFANYVTKYVTKGIDDRSDLPWDDLDPDSGELTGSQPTYRPWSQSSGFGVRMRTHLDAIAAQRRRAAQALRDNVTHALEALGGVLILEDGSPAPGVP